MFGGVEELTCAVKYVFFDVSINNISNNMGAGIHWFSSSGYQRWKILYIHVTNLFCYLVKGIEMKCLTSSRITSRKIFLMAWMNIRFQNGKIIFVMTFLFGCVGKFININSFEWMFKMILCVFIIIVVQEVYWIPHIVDI